MTLDEVLALKAANATRWRDRDDAYWLARLMQEVGELGSSLVGDHKDPPEHELRQIASIALNWLEKRAAATPPTPDQPAQGCEWRLELGKKAAYQTSCGRTMLSSGPEDGDECPHCGKPLVVKNAS